MELLDAITKKNHVSLFSHQSNHDDVIEELEKIKKHLEQKRYGQEKSRFTITNRTLISSLSDQQMRTVATLLPDEILENPMDDSIRNFEAAVFFADVSGFTDLADKYQQVENGASKLSLVMNAYLGSMVQEIFAHKGDVLKFAGDAFIATFKAEKQFSIQECVRRAIDTALIIQKNCKNYQTEVGVILNVKISISAGEVFFSSIGDRNSSYFVIVGDPVWDAKDLQESIKAGEVLVSNLTWFYVQESLYKFEFIKESKFYKVLSFRDYFIDVLQRQHEAAMYISEHIADDRSNRSSPSASIFDKSFERIAISDMHQNMFTIRTTIDISLQNKSRQFLRRFVPRPLMKMIDMDESIESLAEMRNVVILFTNLIVPDKSSNNLIRIVNLAYTKLSKIVVSFEGSMNGVTLFDKDMMFLSIFGLRGQKHVFESRIALRCAYAIYNTFSSEEWKKITPVVSIGVTSGICYSGLVGHSLRRELSVMSVTVNRAARLMITYPGIVSCDQETAFGAKLYFPHHFERLPARKLKGINEGVVCYKFNEIEMSDNNLEMKRKNKFLGRRQNLQMATDFIESAVNNENESCLLVKGDNQDGKSRFLIEFYKYTQMQNFACTIIQLNIQNQSYRFYAMRKLVKRLLKINVNNDMQTAVKKIVGESNTKIHLWMLNSILKTNFEISNDGLINSRFSNDTFMMENFLKLLEKIIAGRKYFFFIDNINFMDKDSLEFFNFVLNNTNTRFLVSTKSDRNMNDRFWEILGHERVKLCQLEALSSDEQNSLVIECLHVDEISQNFSEYIYRNSKGNPGWIITTLHIMKELDFIEKTEFSDFRTVAHIRKTKNLGTISKYLFRESHDIDLMTFDSLSLFEQVFCKCAAALGYEFRRDMLSFLMTLGSPRQIGLAMVKFFDAQIFMCSSPVSRNSRRISANTCHCQNVIIHESCRDLPATSSCAFIKFIRPDFRDLVYGLLTERQRIQVHEKCLIFLHLNSKSCQSCGCEPFSFILDQEIDFKFRDGIVKFEDTSLDEMIEFFDSIGIHMITKKSKLNFKSVKKSTELSPVILNFAAYDFSDCKCFDILRQMYQEMIKHCHGSKDFLKLIDTKIKYARMMLMMQSDEFDYLEEAMALLTRALDQLEVRWNFQIYVDIFNENFIIFICHM